MGTLKIELDLPEFRDKLEVSIVVKKDGTLVVPPSIKRDESIFNPGTITPNIPNFRDPYPGEKKLEIRDPMPGEGIEVGDNPSINVGPYCNSINSSQDDNVKISTSNVVDSMINGQW